MKEFNDKKKVMIPCRFSFLHCWEPDSVNGSEPKYSISAIIPKSDTKTINRIKAAIEVAKQESISKWGGKIPPNLKLPLRDGDIDRPDDEAYANSYVLNANSRVKPQIPGVWLSPNTHTSAHLVSMASPMTIPVSRSYRFPSFRNCGNNRCGAKGMLPLDTANLQYWRAAATLCLMSPAKGEQMNTRGR